MLLKTLVTLLGAATTVWSLPSGGDTDENKLGNTAQNSGFERFDWVTLYMRAGDRLARSSAPYYGQKDSDQRITADSIKFLKQKGITHVISLNYEADTENIKTPLEENGIAYTPLPVPDYGSPELEDFQKGYETFLKYRTGTLIWCGYGHGRTGTMAAALQLYVIKESPSPQPFTSENLYDANHVETDMQRDMLQQLQTKLGLKGEKRPIESDSHESQYSPPQKKPNVAVDTESGSAPGAALQTDIDFIIDEMGYVSEDVELLSPLLTEAGEGLINAEEESAIQALVERYPAARSLTDIEIKEGLDKFIADYPAREAGAVGASAIGDADLMAALDSLPAVAETELLGNAEVIAALDAEAEAFGDEDIIAMMEAAPAVPEEEIGAEVLVEGAEGLRILEPLIEAVLELA